MKRLARTFVYRFGQGVCHGDGSRRVQPVPVHEGRKQVDKVKLRDRKGPLLWRLRRRVAEQLPQVLHCQTAFLVIGGLAEEKLVLLDCLDGQGPGRLDADGRARGAGMVVQLMRRGPQLFDLDGQQPRVRVRISRDPRPPPSASTPWPSSWSPRTRTTSLSAPGRPPHRRTCPCGGQSLFPRTRCECRFPGTMPGQ